MMFHVIDRHTNKKHCSYQSRTRANNKADKLDNEYGAYRYIVRSDEQLARLYPELLDSAAKPVEARLNNLCNK